MNFNYRIGVLCCLVILILQLTFCTTSKTYHKFDENTLFTMTRGNTSQVIDSLFIYESHASYFAGFKKCNGCNFFTHIIGEKSTVNGYWSINEKDHNYSYDYMNNNDQDSYNYHLYQQNLKK